LLLNVQEAAFQLPLLYIQEQLHIHPTQNEGGITLNYFIANEGCHIIIDVSALPKI